MIPRVITCARCGSETVATGPRTKYCPPCSYFVRLEKQNARRSQGKTQAEHTKIITCAICGKEVVVNSKAARAKYCPECSAKMFKVSTKRHRAKEKEELAFDAGNYPIEPKSKWTLAEPKVIECERCGCEVVLTDARQFNRKYCDDCKPIVYAELMRKASRRAKAKSKEPKRCARCGIVLEETKSNQKYCGDCRAAAKLEQSIASYHRKREERETSPFKGMAKERKKKKPRVSQIENLNEAARKAGMSYGKYVAMLAMQKQKRKKVKS